MQEYIKLNIYTYFCIKNLRKREVIICQNYQRQKETAEYLGISYWLVNQLVRRKQIPCARVGGRVLFRVQALDEYLKNKEQESLKK